MGGGEALLFLSVPGAVLAVVVLFKAAAELLGAAGHVVAVLPLAPAQDLELVEAGTTVVSVQGPAFAHGAAGIEAYLLDATGARVPGRRVRTRGVRGRKGRTRLVLARFDVPAPGRYRLETSGEDAVPGDQSHRLVLTHDERARTIELVLVIVLAATVLLTCLALVLAGLVPAPVSVA